jgi:pimeloyl-ACP methyl ester carboxylesterase
MDDPKPERAIRTGDPLMEPLVTPTLPHGIRSRFIDGVNGLRVHMLEAGHETPGRPCLLLLHGFPELAYSWRHVMLPLAALGFHVVAPDQRGYGRTTGWSADYDAPLAPFAFTNLVRDALGVVAALGHREVAAVIGHDFGSPVAAWCALTRPDVFRRVALMSAPFAGGSAGMPPGLDAALAALPRPRKHYHAYYATRPANAEMMGAAQGLHDFLRAYYHHKSADWAANKPYRLRDWSAEDMAKLPTYYVMDRAETMPETVAHEMPGAAEIARCAWLTDAELAVYVGEYRRTGFQGGLNWYRTRFAPEVNAELDRFAGRSIDVPSIFIAGESDWGVFQAPGAFERMQGVACTRMAAAHLIPGAGHWVQQERPARTVDLLRDLLALPATEANASS